MTIPTFSSTIPKKRNNNTMTVPNKRVKYLNNRDLLSEIHKSKCSFSSFSQKDFSQHDIIVADLKKITQKIILEAKKNRAKRIGIKNFIIERDQGNKKVKLADLIPDYKKIPKTDIIFRIMTYDHIPLSPGRKKSTKPFEQIHLCNN